MRRATLAFLLGFLTAGCSSSTGTGTASGGGSNGSTAGGNLATTSASTGASRGAASSSGTRSSATSGNGPATNSSSGATTAGRAASGGTTASGGASTGSASAGGLCSGSPIFCDDFTDSALAPDYTEYLGTWARGAGTLTVTDPTAWERPRASLTGVAALATGVSDFDVTFAGSTQGDYGFGLVWGGTATNEDGYAVIVHPAQFQGIYLKQLVPGHADVNLATTPLPAGLAGTPMTVRVMRLGSTVTVWLNGTQMLSASDGAGGVTGVLGLTLSDTNNAAGSGATFTLLRVDQAGPFAGGTGSGTTGTSGGTTTSAGTTTNGDASTSGTTTNGGASTGGATSSGDASTSGTTTNGGASTGGTYASQCGNPTGLPLPNGVPTKADGTSWTLAFDDEFNGTLVDTTVWNTDPGNWGHTTTYASNTTESGGYLILTLASASSGAALSTNLYTLPVGGYTEACVYLPGSGTTVYNWPAWWTSGPNWPAAGENDIIEGIGTLEVNYHSPSGAHAEAAPAGTWAGAFHTYGLYRHASSCDVYWDGQLMASYPTDDNGLGQTLLFDVDDAVYSSGNSVYGTASQVLADYARAWE